MRTAIHGLYSPCFIKIGIFVCTIAACYQQVLAQGYALSASDTLPITITRSAQSGSELIFYSPAQAYKFKPFAFRTTHSDIPIATNGKDLIYSSDGIQSQIGKTTKSGAGHSREIYQIGKYQGVYFRKPQMLQGGIHSKNDDGPGALTEDRSIFVFEKTGLKGNGSDSKSQLFYSESKRKRWGKRQKFWFCSKSWNYFEPTISRDGKTIVFASDMPGGYGATDLYVSRLNQGGWSNPVNLGPDINTAGPEAYPSFDKKGNLFYSSNLNSGLGGFDIFLARFEAQSWISPMPLSSPFNSSADDFQVIWEKDGVSGYFASNREAAWSDEILELERNVDVEILVQDSKTGDPVIGALIEIRNGEGIVSDLESDSSGVVHYFCRPSALLEMDIAHPNFLRRRVRIGTSECSIGDKLAVTVGLSFEKKFLLHGKLCNETTKLGISAGSLRVFNKLNEDELGYVLDSLGNYRIEFPRNETFIVVFGGVGFLSQIFEVSTLPPNSSFEKNHDVFLYRGEEVLLRGQVVDFLTGKPLAHVSLRVVNNNNQQLGLFIESDAAGRFWTSIPKDSSFNCSVIASKTGYFSARLDVEESNYGNSPVFLKMKLAEYGVDKVVKIIYFDYGQSLLAPLSKKDLNEIHYFMIENPEAVLEIGAHTDSRGAATYNLKLSQSRAEEIVEFIAQRKAVPRERLRATGYGESRLLNSCDDSKKCTEEGHLENRRAEIKVVKLGE